MSVVRLHTTVGVKVGHVQVGGGAPIAVQSMTLTDTADARATAAQWRAYVEKHDHAIRRFRRDWRDLHQSPCGGRQQTCRSTRSTDDKQEQRQIESRQIRCPLTGERQHRSQDECDVSEKADEQYTHGESISSTSVRENPSGIHREPQDLNAIELVECRRWFDVVRDTSTDEIRSAGEPST
jgi:sarcosine oxidase delta subunit